LIIYISRTYGTVILIKSDGKRTNLLSGDLGKTGDFIASDALGRGAEHNVGGWLVGLSPDKTFVASYRKGFVDLQKHFPQIKPSPYWQTVRESNISQLLEFYGMIDVDTGKIFPAVSPSGRYYMTHQKTSPTNAVLILDIFKNDNAYPPSPDTENKIATGKFPVLAYEYIWSEDERYIIARDFGNAGNAGIGESSVYAYDMIENKISKISDKYSNCAGCHMLVALSPTKIIEGTPDATYFIDLSNNKIKKIQILDKYNKFIGIIQ